MKIDKIIKSKRKTLAVQITNDACLVVRAPRSMPDFLIKMLLRKRRAWIQKKQEIMREKIINTKTKQFIQGEKFLYLGESYKLKIITTTSARSMLKLDKKGQQFLLASSLNYDPEQARAIFLKLYKKLAREVISLSVQAYAIQHNFLYNKIRITSALSRWGSCSSKGNLSFTWRLIMATQEVIDYVILHELAHLKEQNHSKNFWSLVEKICPLYKIRKKWLKDNGHKLDLYFYFC